MCVQDRNCIYVWHMHRLHVQSQSPCVHRPRGYGTRIPSAPARAQGLGRVLGPQGLSRLGLVLALCGCEEVIQDAPKVVKCGPFLWALLPAQHHEVVQLFRTVVRSHHSVASLQVLNDFRVGHSWKDDGKRNIKALILGT